MCNFLSISIASFFIYFQRDCSNALKNLVFNKRRIYHRKHISGFFKYVEYFVSESEIKANFEMLEIYNYTIPNIPCHVVVNIV